MKMIYLFSMIVLFSGQSFARIKIQTQSLDINQAAYVPLYDCNIYRNHRLYQNCTDLTNAVSEDAQERLSIDLEGKAFPCSYFGDQDLLRTCRKMASTVRGSARYSFDCSLSDNVNTCQDLGNEYASGQVTVTTKRDVTRGPVTIQLSSKSKVINTAEGGIRVQNPLVIQNGKTYTVIGFSQPGFCKDMGFEESTDYTPDFTSANDARYIIFADDGSVEDSGLMTKKPYTGFANDKMTMIECN